MAKSPFRLRLAAVYDISTGAVVDGVEVDLPPGEARPRTAEEAEAIVDRLLAAAALAPPRADAYAAAAAAPSPCVVRAVAKARLLVASKAKAARECARRVRAVDFRPGRTPVECR